MNENSGWIKLHRKILKWGWYDDLDTRVTFLHFILSANHEDREWHGVMIKRGELIFSLRKMAKEIGISIRSLRTSIKHLKVTQEVTQFNNSNYTHISINNYIDYQSSDTVNDTRVTQHRHSSDNKQELKNIRIKETYKEIINHFNQITGRKARKVDEKAVDYWMSLYSLEEIKSAIEKIPSDDFWRDKMDLTILFRRKNPQGEAVDYIGQLINKKQKLIMKRFDTL